MKKEKIIKIATTMGLSFNESNNFPDAIAAGRLVFDGCNGQRFIIDECWNDEKTYKALGDYLILFGKRLKCMEIIDVININHD